MGRGGVFRLLTVAVALATLTTLSRNASPLPAAGSVSGASSASAARNATRFKPKTIVSFGDSMTSGSELRRPSSEAYPYLLGRFYGATVRNLAVGGAASGRNTKGDIIRSQLPLLRGPCGLATLSVGTNDVTLVAGGYYTLKDYRRNVHAILAVLKKRCGRVAVTTVIDNRWNVLAKGRDAKVWARSVALENAYIRRLHGVTLVDLNADPRLHRPSSFSAPLLLHPNAGGQAYIAEDIEAAL